MSALTPLTKAQIAALRQLAEPKSNGLNLLFNKPELFTIGVVFGQLVEMGYAKRKRLNNNWCKFKITREGRAKWAEVKDE